MRYSFKKLIKTKGRIVLLDFQNGMKEFKTTGKQFKPKIQSKATMNLNNDKPASS